MSNKVLITFCFLGICLHLSAQTTVEGKVVDRKGNPIPGAKVEVPKTKESVLTELDGTFSMTTQKIPRKVNVYYVGILNNFIVKINQQKRRENLLFNKENM